MQFTISILEHSQIHLFNYINLMKFLENPDKDWVKTKQNLEQLTLF
jgi:hypothetical protein